MEATTSMASCRMSSRRNLQALVVGDEHQITSEDLLYNFGNNVASTMASQYS